MNQRGAGARIDLNGGASACALIQASSSRLKVCAGAIVHAQILCWSALADFHDCLRLRVEPRPQ